MGWSGVKNGALMALAADRFDAFVTDVSALPIAVLVLVARSNELRTLLPLVPRIEAALGTLQPGMLVRIGA
jgi:hypothetical protein